jgi:hypothetical protein
MTSGIAWPAGYLQGVGTVGATREAGHFFDILIDCYFDAMVFANYLGVDFRRILRELN